MIPGDTQRPTGRIAVWTAVAGTVFIATGAFWLSFTALADLARRSGIDPSQAWAWPLIVDGIIVVTTVSVVALAGQRAACYPWLLLMAGAAVSVTANAIHAVVAAHADVPAALAGAVAAVPPLVLLAITHLTVGEEFVAKRLGHDAARSIYAVDRSRGQGAGIEQTAPDAAAAKPSRQITL